VPVVAPRGAIDLSTSRELASQLGELSGEQGVALVLDLTDVTFMDSIGLGVLLKAAGRFRRQEKRFLIVAQDGPVQRLLELSGLSERLQLYADRDEALAAARKLA
jgi:anti-sigma B factor antagonist